MVIITGNYGQLGNRLIVFANAIAAAREHGLRVVNPAFAEYAPLFDATSGDPLCRYPQPWSRAWISAGAVRRIHAATVAGVRFLRRLERRIGHVPGVRRLDIGWFGECDLDSPEFVALARRRGVLLLKGWQFRARSSFERHADAIRDYFRPRAEHQVRAEAVIGKLRRSADVVVGVHIRHGDYRTFQAGRFFFETERYAAWMRSLRDTFADRRVAFLIASNAPQPRALFRGLAIEFAPGTAVEDMHALALCDSIIGPPSTFSQWASFAGRTPLCTLVSKEDLPRLERFEVTAHFDERRQSASRTSAVRPVA